MGRFLVENERLLVVAASTMIMSLSHTALRPVLPVFAKVSHATCTIIIGESCVVVCVWSAWLSWLLHLRPATKVDSAALWAQASCSSIYF